MQFYYRQIYRDQTSQILSVEWSMVKHMRYGRRVQAITLLDEVLRKSEVARRLGVHCSSLWRLEQFGVKDPTKVRMTRKKSILMFAIKVPARLPGTGFNKSYGEEQVQAIKTTVKEMLCLTSFQDEPEQLLGKRQPKNYPAHPTGGLEDAMQGSTEETILGQSQEEGKDQAGVYILPKN